MCRCTKDFGSKAALLGTLSLRSVNSDVKFVLVRAGLFQDLLYFLTTLDQLFDAEAASVGMEFFPVGQTGGLGKGEYDVVLAAHHGHHRVLRHWDYGFTVKKCTLIAKEVLDNGQETRLPDKSGRRKDVKPYRCFDDKAEALRTVKEDSAWTSPARIVKNREGI